MGIQQLTRRKKIEQQRKPIHLAKASKSRNTEQAPELTSGTSELFNENNDMNLSQIQELIKFVSKSGVSEVSIEQKDFKITIKAQEHKGKVQEVIQVAMPQAAAPAMIPAAAPAQPAAAPAPAAAAPKAEEAAGNTIEVRSPMIGTFYRASAPDKPPFVEVGTVIKPGDTVCVIEAMKLFNEIESEVSGKIVKVLVNDSTPVEYDQPLFLVEPA
jgi:acetyl-CoA carboxylase biotin carboxyl carrier protein